MNTQELETLTKELIECSEGRRGWVSVSKARASRIGADHEVILGCARAFNLKVERHGRMGWSASRPFVLKVTQTPG